MPEAVIVATGRTPIGRANKGSLVECRPDDLPALVIREVLAKVPQLDPQPVEDVMWGCGQPAGEAGYNLARVAAVLAGLHEVPGVTVNRYCSSSLQTIRMAAHAIKAGEGDVFIAGGVETVSRYLHGASDVGPPQRGVRRGRGPHGRARPRRQPARGRRSRASPRRLHRHGPDGGERRRPESVTPGGAGRVRRPDPAPRRRRARSKGFFDREIMPVTLADGTVVTKDDGPRPGTTVEKLASLKPVFREGGKSPPATRARSTTVPPPSW